MIGRTKNDDTFQFYVLSSNTQVDKTRSQPELHKGWIRKLISGFVKESTIKLLHFLKNINKNGQDIVCIIFHRHTERERVNEKYKIWYDLVLGWSCAIYFHSLAAVCWFANGRYCQNATNFCSEFCNPSITNWKISTFKKCLQFMAH